MNLLRILLLFFLLQLKAYALIEVDITRGNLSPLPIAVSPLSANKESLTKFENILKKKDLGSEISLIVENNLRLTGLFNPLKKDAFLQKPEIAHLKPRFEDWSLIKAQALITGKVEFKDDKVRVEFEQEKQDIEKRLKASGGKRKSCQGLDKISGERGA